MSDNFMMLIFTIILQCKLAKGFSSKLSRLQNNKHKPTEFAIGDILLLSTQNLAEKGVHRNLKAIKCSICCERTYQIVGF